MEFTALNSPAKPRTVTKYDPTNGNRTVSGTSGIIPRRSTTLYEKTSSTEKTNVIPAETKYVRVELVLLAAYHDSSSLDLKLMFEIPPVIVCITIPVWQAYLVNVQSVGRYESLPQLCIICLWFARKTIWSNGIGYGG